jgi:membrane protease YdiL (CAAX protease family)
MLAGLVPAIACLVSYAYTREALKRWKAPLIVYPVAIAIGFLVPFMSYFGSHYASFPWDYSSRLMLARAFCLNIFLMPLWEEIIWRGCFLERLRSFTSKPKAIVLSSVAWTAWHAGFLVYLHGEGIPIRVLAVLPLMYFCAGIILAAIYELGHRSLWPCVLLHAAFNASTAVYYTTYDRSSELSSYIAELIAALVVAGVLYVIANRNRSTRPQNDEDASVA